MPKHGAKCSITISLKATALKVNIWSDVINYVEFVLHVKSFWGLKFLMLVALWVAAFFIPRGAFGLGEFQRFCSDHQTICYYQVITVSQYLRWLDSQKNDNIQEKIK